ncbi:tRNA pseudouridine synthase A isoform X2 [Drosophila novamexicana]|uniref:tRNA pseudouridine synthase A isoform X2 n=1 Tax=Drosophila novamexicana TaxID=47314 RepID=UPI0011E5CBC5|nr:tRNA pseudouridine synthase A isoform X2 [Drosophila novamexicana]
MLLRHILVRFPKAVCLKTLLRTDISRYSLCSRHKSFAVAMTEALDKLEQEREARKVTKEAEDESVKEANRLKRTLKRKKWVDWKAQDEEDAANGTKRAPFDPADRIKRKKSAILLSYCGANYYGMQRNPGMQTIEEELFKAMLKHKWITEDSFEQVQIASFQRAARTDKGVSAARQVCSVKLPEELDLLAFNADLPDQIRLFGVERVTKGFNAKDQCNARTYTYTLPTIAFAACDEQHEQETYRIPLELQELVNATLKLYEGTKNFHNFTSKKNFLDPSAKRFIMSFTCSAPFLSPQSIEFVTLQVKGQSFMLHQIRKMVGLAIAIVRGNTTTATLERALTEERLDLPMAPGLGLVLDTVHYERYNDRYGKDGIHNPLTWEAQEEQVRQFIEQHIYANIYKTETEQRNMLDWLSTLHFHSYDTRRDEPPPEATGKQMKNEDDDGEE